MIKFFIFSLIAISVGVFLQLQLADDPGTVLVSFRSYDIETSLGTAVIALLVVFVLFYGLVWLVKTVNPAKLFSKDSLFVFSRKRKAVLNTESGLRLLLLGNWQQSYKLLVESAENVDSPLSNYLAASMAAFQHGDKPSWTFCLNRAEKSSPSAKASVRALKALMELKSGELEKSLAILLPLHKELPNNPQVLNTLKDIYLSVDDWERLSELLPAIEKNKTLKPDESFSLAEKVTAYKLSQAASSENLNKLDDVWKSIPKPLKASEHVIAEYVNKLIEKDKDTEAFAVLGTSLKRKWSNSLVRLFGFLKSNEPQKSLLLLEGFAKNQTNNAEFTLTLGRVSMQNQLWTKAQEYFSKALDLSSDATLTAEINTEMARLLEHLGEYKESISYYRNALGILKDELPHLPMPAPALTLGSDANTTPTIAAIARPDNTENSPGAPSEAEAEAETGTTNSSEKSEASSDEPAAAEK